jgi:hypothetical protein
VRTTTETGIDRWAPTRPGEVLLEEFLAPLGITQAKAARRMGSTANRLNELVRGKGGARPTPPSGSAASWGRLRSSG